MTSSKRIYQIDLFRFIAAIGVVLFHYTFRGATADNLSSIKFPILAPLFKYGYLGVDLFFIISGFVILLSIKDESIRKFFTSRVSRLYPAYWLCLIITSVVILFYGAPNFKISHFQIGINASMFQSFFNVKNIDGAYWSLGVELKFYILIGLYLLIKKYREISIYHVIYFWLLLMIPYLILKDSTTFKYINHLLIIRWSPYFIAGILYYQIYSSRINIKDVFLAVICLGLSIYLGIEQIQNLEEHYHVSFSPTIISLIIFTSYALMFIVSIGGMQFINSKNLLKLGILTYPLYLLHQNIGYIIFNNFNKMVDKYLLLFLTITLMLIISYIIHRVVEKPLSYLIKTKLTSLISKKEAKI